MNCNNPKCGKKIKGPHYRNCWGDFCNMECAREACFHAQGKLHIYHKCPFGTDPRKKYPELPEPSFYEGGWVEK